MYSIISEHRFSDIMSEKGNGFSYDGAQALFQHLTSCEETEIGEEFDPVGLRCDYSEYASALEACKDCGIEIEIEIEIEDEDEDEDALEAEAKAQLERRDILIAYEGGCFCIVRCI